MAESFWIKFELREKHFYKKSTSLQKQTMVSISQKWTLSEFYVWKIWSHTHDITKKTAEVMQLFD